MAATTEMTSSAMIKNTRYGQAEYGTQLHPMSGPMAYRWAASGQVKASCTIGSGKMMRAWNRLRRRFSLTVSGLARMMPTWCARLRMMASRQVT